MPNPNRDFDHENRSPDDIRDNEDGDSDNSSGGESGSLSERLRDILSEDGDGGEGDNGVLQWLQALDLQVVGACRADERLKPLLKMNVSSGVAEDHFLAQLSQHFEVPEVGMLARCLCIPLVSIRVGRVTRQGSLLCPTGTRGNLNLTLLPSSGLRISYIGDDGCVERLATLSCNSESFAEIEEIPADKSGLTLKVKLPDGQASFFWCSEPSKPLGFELLAKMKDLLKRKPSLAELTGISESRLDCFATYLRSYLGATARTDGVNSALSSGRAEYSSNFPLSSTKSSRSRCIGGQTGKPHSLYQGSLSPRSNSFKDCTPRNSSSIRNGVRERFRRRGDVHCIFSAIDSSTSVAEVFSTDQTESRKVSECISCSFSPLSFLDSIGKSAFLPSSSLPSPRFPTPQILTNSSSVFSPYYCWVPPCASSMQYTITPPHSLISTVESSPLPPLSTLLSAATSSSSSFPPKLPFDLTDVPSLPSLLPDLRLPLSVSSFIRVSSSQQMPTFTPLMCDPIVHIPVINVCSGQGYLVSAGPSISTAISPLHPNIVNPMIQETESLVEKNARETLRLLLSSTQANTQLTDACPLFKSNDSKNSMVVGSRGFYTGTRDVEVIANNLATTSLVPLAQSEVDVTRSSDDHNLETQDSEECCRRDEDTKDSINDTGTKDSINDTDTKDSINDTGERLDPA